MSRLPVCGTGNVGWETGLNYVGKSLAERHDVGPEDGVVREVDGV